MLCENWRGLGEVALSVGRLSCHFILFEVLTVRVEGLIV